MTLHPGPVTEGYDSPPAHPTTRIRTASRRRPAGWTPLLPTGTSAGGPDRRGLTAHRSTPAAPADPRRQAALVLPRGRGMRPYRVLLADRDAGLLADYRCALASAGQFEVE